MTMHDEQDDWKLRSARDLIGRWVCFDDSVGRCPAEVTGGTVQIGSPVVGGDQAAVVQFDGVEGYPANRPVESNLKDNRLEFMLGPARFQIVPCGQRKGRRVIHCIPTDGTKPGSWTAEEEDAKLSVPAEYDTPVV